MIVSTPFISLMNPVSAGYFFLVGVFSFIAATIDWTDIKKLVLSPGSFILEKYEKKLEQKVEDAKSILEEIRKVEERISFVLTEQMVNRGGQRHQGDFGEEAEFAIYRAFQAITPETKSPRLIANMKELHRDLGFQLCNGIFGLKWLNKSAAKDWLLSTSYQSLPDRYKIQELAELDQVDLVRVKDILEAYIAFMENDKVPSGELLNKLYEYKNYSA
ncbi:hypothetical protein ILFOPFJJ_04829 [Ensifer psoraleae]|uniref:hypothetical protein n=1 Tax=Sinorhizobium psoraleae TaxID=520838 RepID=UPI0015682676|nr:hypothetical protein [Sinorhizobium psoraleae]NRP73911.1 hypothetical protein [Sinorhizobium psoraleae]